VATTSRVSSAGLQTTNYAKDVVAGKVVASKRVIQACQRHLDDLKRSKRKEYPYYFDAEAAYRPIEFMERFCVPSQGDFEKLELQPWDHFIIGSLFGWLDKRTKLRRFRSGLIFVARKQGKSVKFASGLSLFCASKDGERGARVYQLANALKQAREATFNECTAMVKGSPELNRWFRARHDAIHFDPTNSKIMPLASDSETLDSLNCHLGVFDEVHEYKNYKLINVIKNSTGSRRQSLILYITTAGFVITGPLIQMYEHGCDVLDGMVPDERTFYYLAEIDEEDDVDDPACWVKANPNMGISVQLDEMIKEWEERKHVPAERGDFITKRLNVFVRSSEQPFVPIEVLKRNEETYDVAKLKGRTCVGGFDLSNTEDFTSACLEFPLDDGQLFVLSHSFVPEEKVKRDNENIPFLEWETAGLLTICPGSYVDHRRVYKWFEKATKLYSILLVTYDPANAYRLVNDLQLLGGPDWTKVVRQGSITLSPALKDIKEHLLGGRVISNCDPLLRWYINNVKLVDDRNGNWLPTKQGRYRKIDGFAAWLNAHTETMRIPVLAPNAAPVTFISRKDL